MLTDGSLTVSSGRIAAFIKTTEIHLSNILTNVASGKRVRSPEDSIPDYFHAQRYRQNNSAYDKIRSNVAELSAMVDVAVNAGESVFNKLDKMRVLVNDYYKSDVTQEEKNIMSAEFTRLIEEVNLLKNNAVYDGKQLIQDSSSNPLKTIMLDPHDPSQTYSVSFSAEQIADPSALTLGSSDEATEAAAVQNELNKAASYLASASVYKRGLQAQYNILDTKIMSNEMVESNLTDANAEVEIARAVHANIRHQAATSMMAQANIARASVLKLFQ